MKRTWNYCLLAYPDGEDTYFRVDEVHYENEVPVLHTVNGATIGGTMKEIETILLRINECLLKPILWGDARFPEEYKQKEENHE